MTLIDVNILLYAYSADAPHQRAAAQYLSGLIESGAMVALTWITVWGFLRLATNPRISSNPMPAEIAFAIIDGLLKLPNVAMLAPGPRHLELLQKLVTEHQVTGPKMTDAVLAAIALENEASLASTDQDFARFTNLRWVNPFVK